MDKFAQRGASLVQVMLASAMLGGLIVTSMKFFQQQKQMSNAVARDMDLNALKYKINKLLTDDETCKMSLTRNGAQNNINSIFSIDPPYADTLYDNAGNVFFKAGSGALAKVNIGNRPTPQFEIIDVEGNVQVIDPLPPITKYRVFLSYHIKKLTDQLGGALIKENVAVEVSTDAAGIIQTCSLQHTEYKTYCQGPGAIWDDVTNRCVIAGYDPVAECNAPGQAIKGFDLDMSTGMYKPRCRGVFNGANAICPSGEVNRGFLDNGMPICTALEAGDMAHLLDPTGADCSVDRKIKFEIVAGKLSVVCVP